jgi:DNA-directed RNA polymerase subunit E'/Rpb7
MFILTIITDIIRIPPEDFSFETSGLVHQLELKFANKVCVSHFSFSVFSFPGFT